MTGTAIVPCTSDDHWAGYVETMTRAFGGTVAEWTAWMAGMRDHATARVAVDEPGRVAAAASALVVGQFFGGRAVRSAAISAVCARPEAKGTGGAAAALEATLAAGRDEGAVVSTLWPSRTGLYRRVGYGVAGVGTRWSAPADALIAVGAASGAGGLSIEPDPPGDEVQALHGRRVRHYDGPIDRPAWWWAWRDRPRIDAKPRFAYGVRPEAGGPLTGHVIWTEGEAEPPFGHATEVTELAADDVAALAAILGVLGRQKTLSGRIAFSPRALGPDAELRWLLGHHLAVAQPQGPWLVRLLDVAGAVAARGWPDRAAERIDLAVATPGAGAPRRWRLTVADGHGTATPGGDGTVAVSLAALSAWWAGGLRAASAARLGLASGPGDAIAALDRLTGDRDVWLPDQF